MARATELPIYRVAYDLLQLVTKLTSQFPRHYLHLMVVETVAKIPNEPVISKAARSILRSIENSMTAVSASRGGVA